MADEATIPLAIDPQARPVYPGVTLRGATFSSCGTYRYTLRRAWGAGPIVAFIGLNPSTADAMKDDPTIRRCVRFARDWGFDGLVMLNLFALRSTDPNALLAADDPVGPGNDEVLAAVCEQAALTVEAWGAFPRASERARQLDRVGILQNAAVLGRTKDGHPRHPLYMPADARPVGGLFQTPAVLPIDLEVAS
jgi:hypothetical protein